MTQNAQWLKKKDLADFTHPINKRSNTLKKTLGPFDLTILGLAGIIGSGIFVVTGYGAAHYAGPAIMVSFFLAGVACIFTALAYAELATLIPSSGGSYAYTYVTFGQAAAFFLSWINVLAYTAGAATAASGWSAYAKGILSSLGVNLPHSLTATPFEGGYVNILSIAVVLTLTLISAFGTKLLSKVSSVLVFAKLFAIFSFIFLAIPCFKASHWEPFAPFGASGIIAGSAFIFLAYTGFDTIATASEECRNPQRDLPIGIVASLLISALIYILVSGCLTGIIPFKELATAQPIAHALLYNKIEIGSKLVAAGAIAALTTVIISNIFGQARVLMSMSRDYLMPAVLKKIHPIHGTPQNGIILSGIVISLIAGFFPVSHLSQLVSMSALLIFGTVSLCVMILRKRYPNGKRSFHCPAVYVIGSLSAFICFGLFLELVLTSIKPFSVAIAVGAVLYITAISQKQPT